MEQLIELGFLAVFLYSMWIAAYCLGIGIGYLIKALR